MSSFFFFFTVCRFTSVLYLEEGKVRGKTRTGKDTLSLLYDFFLDFSMFGDEI